MELGVAAGVVTPGKTAGGDRGTGYVFFATVMRCVFLTPIRNESRRPMQDLSIGGLNNMGEALFS